MNKLNQLLPYLDDEQITVQPNYIYFQSPNKNGEPHTVTTDGEKLIVSGSQPKGPRTTFDDPALCLALLALLGLSVILTTSVQP